MNNQAIKTNNSFLESKIKLRKEAIEGLGNITVLECFRGESLMWGEIKKESKKKIKILSVDNQQYSGIYLKGDNVKFMETMNLKNFDVIDLDAYGVPYKQLEIIFSKKIKSIIIVTFIQTMQGNLPTGLLKKLGYTDTMLKKNRAIFCKNGYEKFKSYLYLNGIYEINSINYHNKHYLFFKT